MNRLLPLLICVLLCGCGGGSTPQTAAAPSATEIQARNEAESQAKALNVPLEQKVELGPGVMLELVFIPKGEVALLPAADGDPAKAGAATVLRNDEAFYLARYELTQAQYATVMDENPSAIMGPDQPVNQASWHNAQAFCKKAGALTKQALALPTAAQWEFACRAFSPAPFSTGSTEHDLEQAGWYRQNSGGQTHPVGRKKPNAFGLYDMHGNVAEWCQDAVPAPNDSAKGERRILRGGSWLDQPRMCRAGSQAIAEPEYPSANMGFRVMLKIPAK